MLWNKCIALDPANVAGLLYTDNVINFIKKSLKEKYKHKFDNEEIKDSLDKIVFETINLDQIKHIRIRKLKTKTKPTPIEQPTPVAIAIDTSLLVQEPKAEQIPNSGSIN